jgi:cobaltochelatase CobS subunit
MMSKIDLDITNLPDTTVNVREVFGIDVGHHGAGLQGAAIRLCPRPGSGLYLFDRDTTLAILAGFAHNRRVMVSGYHGTGKSTHIEQVAARLNWPCVRVNLDSHMSAVSILSARTPSSCARACRSPNSSDGILPWAYQHNVALVFDEYDAGRPDVMFVIQRVLESSGRLTLLDQSRVIRPHPGVPPVRHRQHGRPWRYDRALPWHPADQPGADGPLVDRHHAELSATRPGGRYRCSPRSRVTRPRTMAGKRSIPHGPGCRS